MLQYTKKIKLYGVLMRTLLFPDENVIEARSSWQRQGVTLNRNGHN